MQRIRELIALAKEAHPTDRFFDNLDQTLTLSPGARAQYQAYERALSSIDQDSWNVLRKKTISHFMDHRKGQKKQGFFNQLNEAFAYEHLIKSGAQQIRVMKETGKTQPDILFTEDGVTKYCEVKTICISDDLIRRRETIQVTSSSIYYQLSPEFLSKLGSSIDAADRQLRATGASGLIYLLIGFDDFTLEYYKTYRKQIVACIEAHSATNIHVKVGILGRRRIHKGSLKKINIHGT